MRARRSLFLLLLLVAAGLVEPTAAAANGGASLVLNRTHYLAGDEGVATASVYVPVARRGIFERGPFYLFVATRAPLREGQPIPAGAIRLGTFTIEPSEDGYVELRAPFVAPDLSSGFYSVELCNDPCTIAGFRDQLFGGISIVATRREAALLVQNERLRSRFYGMRHHARRAERRLAAAEEQLDVQLSFGASERRRLSSEVTRLEERLATVRSELAAARDRARSSLWLLGAVVSVIGLAAVWAFRPGRAGSIGPIEDIVPGPVPDADGRVSASSADGANGHRRTEERVWARPR